MGKQAPRVGAPRYGPSMWSGKDARADLGPDHGLDQDEVRVLLARLGEKTPKMPDELVEWLERTFGTTGERGTHGDPR